MMTRMWILILLCLGVAPAGAEPLTLTQGTNIAAAVSPNGEQIAFDLQGTLWVMPIAGGDAKPITEPLMDARQPQWSRDSKRIIFQSFKDGGWHVYAVGADGQGLTQITSGGFDEREPVWSPDGKWIAFSSDRNGSYDIWVSAADGSEPRMLTTSNSNDHSPTWSPDGKRIVFVSDREGAAGLHSITFEGVGERLMAPLEGSIAGPSFNRDGTKIAFVQTTRGGSRLNVMDASTTVVMPVSAPEEDVFPFRAAWVGETDIVYTADAAVKRLAWSKPKAKPTLIPFAASVPISRVAYQRKAYDFTSTTPRAVKGIRGPKLSPDGRDVVFAALGDIWTANAMRAGTKPQRVTNDAALDFDPAWSPDGKFIAFVSDRSGKTEIWIHDRKTRKDRQLTTLDSEVQRPVWSPDGARIAFFKVLGLAGLGGGALHTVDAVSGEVKQIRANIWAPSHVSWSPDGSRIVLSALSPASSRFREGLSQFLVVAVDGEPKADRFLTPHPDHSLAMRGDDGPVWSADGKLMVYVYDGRLWTVPVNTEGDIGGMPSRITDELADAPSISADGKAILYVGIDRLQRHTLGGKTVDVHPDFTYVLANPTERYVVRAGKFFDGVKNGYAENVDVVVDGNRIAEIVPRKDWPEDIRVVDASGQAVIPGLMESHSHQTAVFGERLGRLWLAMGVTSVRDPGADPYDALERREAWSMGRRMGPRSFFAGGLTDGTRVFYGFANSVTTPEHLGLEMLRAKRLDYDMIKTYVRMPDERQRAIVAMAHDIGIPVSSHEVYPAASYGTDAVEHLRGTSRRGYSPKQSEMGFSYDDVVDLLARTGMTVTPTMGLSGGFTQIALTDPTLFQHPVYRALFRESERTPVANMSERSRPGLDALSKTVAAMQLAIQKIVDRGGRITAGTDSPFVPYGLSFQVELELYEAAGLSPFQVLQSATIWPAERLGLDQHIGTLEPGKLADMVIVDGDPLARIKDIRNISAVVANGRYLTRDELLQAPKN
jgi:Tol biopolymer transport system component/imidazolonepropionase-like amidohydrolase